MKLGSIVTYLQPFEDEKDVLYTIIEINEAQNWCKIQANLGWAINPIYVANLTDLKLV